jgi:hypothetical protein
MPNHIQSKNPKLENNEGNMFNKYSKRDTMKYMNPLLKEIMSRPKPQVSIFTKDDFISDFIN